MKHRYATLTALSAAAVITLSACGSSSGGMGGMDMGEDSSTTTAPSSGAPADATPSRSADAAAVAEHNDADVMFAQMMLPHHQQAVEMSDMLLEKEDIDPAVMDLATRVKEAQEPEIQQLTGWLEGWDEPLEMTDADMESMDSSMGSMNGMMGEEDMGALEAAEGIEAETMFLESMTEHHNGAVDMAQQEIEEGMFPDAIAMAETIVETQQAEIEEMTALLEQR
ncbi:DUF305 domain-containing protein [Arthrobacter sp. 260]|uniref:DUF305 domain-containing protein n=1 Tax=Arthrobacter sp. 260 TaxID=2735314 RepID=UPI0014913EEF|nr:DUF305 domain-containing protein [Arthrobacter sp. 260]NOJ60934.1 DUF305 domain-containing protein [Arthrobacter sp. 260]